MKSLLKICLLTLLATGSFAQPLPDAPLPDSLVRFGKNIFGGTDYEYFVYTYDQRNLKESKLINENDPNNPILKLHNKYEYYETGKLKSETNLPIGSMRLYQYTYDGLDSIISYKYNSGSELFENIKFGYNEKRQLISRRLNEGPNSLIVTTTYEYNESGQLTESISTQISQSSTTPSVKKVTNEYNSEGKLIVQKEFSSTGLDDWTFKNKIVFEYNETSGELEVTKNYNAMDELISVINRFYDGSIDSSVLHNINGSTVNVGTKKYNDKKQLIEEIRYNSTGQIFLKFEYFYNEDGSRSMTYSYIENYLTNTVYLFLEEFYKYNTIVNTTDHSNITPQIVVSPNPAGDWARISGLSGVNGIKIFNQLGELVMIKKTNGFEIIMDFSNIANGIYYLIPEGSKKLNVLPVIIQH
ncbi:MAG: hypothetical protein IPN72_17910 [Saprospiraceae bacterium]|nr:hypothetical protein [Saprospiraceae bacterium]